MTRLSIASVTVTTNARELVRTQLALLAAQLTPLSETIIVDNASGDGTPEMVANDFPTVTLITLSTNQGVAGAYAAGLEHAVFKRNHDWVWTLDEDSRPAAHTLADLMSALESCPDRERIGLLAPQPVDAMTGAVYPGLTWRDPSVLPKPSAPGGRVEFVDVVISSGSLFRSVAIRAAGLPRRDFFMDLVDFELCLRIRRKGFLVGVARDCILQHTIGTPQQVRELGAVRVRARHAPWREYYKTRNLTFMAWHEFASAQAKSEVLWKTLRHVCGVLAYDPDKTRRLTLIAKGLCDGIAGRLGMRVPPTNGS